MHRLKAGKQDFSAALNCFMYPLWMDFYCTEHQHYRNPMAIN